MWGREGWDKTTKQAPGFRKRPVEGDGPRHSRGRGRGVVGVWRARDTYLCSPERTVWKWRET